MTRGAQLTPLPLHATRNNASIATGEASSFVSAEAWPRETKRLGQVATPEPVALLMAAWVLSGNPRTVLDPAAGPGGLLAACHQLAPNVPLVGVERDAETWQRAKTTAPRGTRLILADYLKADTGLFEGIIANPPYVKAHRLDYSEHDWAAFEANLGTRLDRLTNLYALFLLKIWQDLAPAGRAAVLLPAEFLNANFGDEIKEHLKRVMRPAAVLVFAPSLNLFADALTTSAIVFLDKGRSSSALAPAPAWALCVESIQEAKGVVAALRAGSNSPPGNGGVDLSRLDPREKWLNRLFHRAACVESTGFVRRVGDYFECRRGIATGANDYFCLSRAELQRHQLSRAHVVPCITKAVDADGLVFTGEKFERLAGNDRRCFLLDPACNGPALTRYLELGEARAIPARHLPSHRPVWYRPENRPVADIWVPVFSRGPAKYVLNMSGAKNLTCFHGLYARTGWNSLPPLLTLFLNSSSGRQAFSQVNRFYGDGLNKLEPKDVEAMSCPVMPKLGAAEASELTLQLRELEESPAQERTGLIDALVARYFKSGG
jgi:adenine-specific DNA-methyltransferase